VTLCERAKPDPAIAHGGAQESSLKRDPSSLEMGSEGLGMVVQYHSLNDSS
jgi:hypothetical protein